MKTIDLRTQPIQLDDLVRLTRAEPVLLLTSDGRELLISEADDFDREVEELRASDAFQKLLDERAKEPTLPLDEVERRLRLLP